ncbi:hypothetical protein MVEN_01664500 [Mycena venus]|uniref:Carbohydrate esterase family 16 protein n=1 Tax=Mycena venus TaxID=2733690 RepID=A0A8H6XPY8_9AGAR|nr:hypothetical protein MVEN_01664500 [Mycena venus]
MPYEPHGVVLLSLLGSGTWFARMGQDDHQSRRALRKDYQEVFPPYFRPILLRMAESNGHGISVLYGNYTIWNYAVGGAVCSNVLTPLFSVPDVVGGQTDWFIQDHVTNNGTKHQKLDMDPSEFVVVVYIGTNDVGIHSFVTDDESPEVSLADLAGCQLQTIRNLYALGARRFIVNSLIPLQITRLYSNSSDPTIYFPAPHDGVAWNKRMFNFVHSMNALIRGGVAALSEEWRGTATIDVFDTYGLFEDMYNHPSQWFNGSIPRERDGPLSSVP